MINDNHRLTALDGSHYRIRYPWSKRKRPAYLGEVNYRWLCVECHEQIPAQRKGMFCCDECAMTHNVSVG